MADVCRFEVECAAKAVARWFARFAAVTWCGILDRPGPNDGRGGNGPAACESIDVGPASVARRSTVASQEPKDCRESGAESVG